MQALPTALHRSFLMTLVVVGVTVGARSSAAQAEGIRPAAVNKPTLTYLPEKRTAVLFGGYPQRGSPLSETWLLDNGCWSQLQISGPPGRAGHGAAYDAARRRLVIFGGSGADGKPLGDTWEFDGEKWEQRSADGPSPRSLVRMTFDERRKRVLLTGGSANATGPHFADVWQWDGRAWTLVTDSGPPARFESAFAYDAAHDVSIVFGGNRSTDRRFTEGALDDTWLLRGSVWSQVHGPGPIKRDHHGMVYHAARGVVVLFGGSSGGMLGDTWTFDGKRWAEQRDSAGPSPRGGVPAMTYDSHRKHVVMYGGWGASGALTDLWAWDGGWARIPTSECTAR